MACCLTIGVRPWSVDFRRLVDQLASTSVPELSSAFVHALVAAEDHRFWHHCGVDLRSVVRAIVRFANGRREGASTIQQQLVRVVTNRYEVSLARKSRELVFAIALGKFFSRDQLVRLYLARGYYGHRMSGVRAACAHLGIGLRTASPREAAEVVARLRYPEPSVATPVYVARVEQRVRHILRRQGLDGSSTRPNLAVQPTAAGVPGGRRG
jgi:membrane carboxypeptidase/penicillin-binding protein